MRRAQAILATAAALAVLACAGAAGAHEGVPLAGEATDASRVALVLLIALAATLYARGHARLRARGARRTAAPALAFASGLAALAAALVWPLDAPAGRLFVFHMLQHELLMLVAAPLLVAYPATSVLLWGLPAPLRRTLPRLVRAACGRAWRFLTAPLVATALHGLALWLWHVPAFFDAAARTPALHELQHVSFLATALLFWWAVLRPRGRAAAGAAVLCAFATTVHCGLLGALVTLAPTPWYETYAAASRASGLTALEDQQLGGLLMWVPGCAVYAALGVAALGRWIAASGRAARAGGIAGLSARPRAVRGAG